MSAVEKKIAVINNTEDLVEDLYAEIEAGMTLADRRKLVNEFSTRLVWLEGQAPNWASLEFKAAWMETLNAMWAQIDRIVKEQGLV